ncbi:MAG: hypothetical protein JWL81_1217 [Verrucomicrobiales bacterium]|nr:hypothetical protein [Verrucomicrobiales bacterium]
MRRSDELPDGYDGDALSPRPGAFFCCGTANSGLGYGMRFSVASPLFSRPIRARMAWWEASVVWLAIALALPWVARAQEAMGPERTAASPNTTLAPVPDGDEKSDTKWKVPLPVRPAGASAGSAVARAVTGLPLAEREAILEAEVLSGNVPDWWRSFVRIPAGPPGAALRVWVAPDYLAVGNEVDFFQIPLTPDTARRLADRLGCTLPNPRLVDAVHAAAPLKLVPCPIPPAPGMVTVEWFLEHQKTVRAQREESLGRFPWGSLVAGTQKDVVLTALLDNKPGKVAIYGWHRPDGSVIQPLYTGHGAGWVDYSHGIRLVRKEAELAGKLTAWESVLTDPAMVDFFKDTVPDKTSAAPATPAESGKGNADGGGEAGKEVQFSPHFPGEELGFFQPEPGVRVALDVPSGMESDAVDAPVKLVIYALPNGNSIEETMGRTAGPEESFRFGIQHIAAQTRWLRSRMPGVRLMVAYVECAEKSWPLWCRKHGDSADRIGRVVETVKRVAASKSKGVPRVTLSGHSGGGAFIFRYLDGSVQLPEAVERIVFLDSNYAYNAARGHAGKLESWLKSGPDRALAVVAYHDSAALLNGKTFVSESGGTWGRSRAMLEDFDKWTAFGRVDSGDLSTFSALSGRVRFLLMENPEKKVLHTRLVERNGFIHSQLVGGPLENAGYVFFGEPVYREWVQ